MDTPLPLTAAAAPRSAYLARLAACRAELVRLDRADRWLANARLAIVLAGLGAGWFVYRDALPSAVLILLAGGFLLLAVVHERVIRRQRRTSRTAAFYERGLRRLDRDWSDGPPGTRHLEDEHPYARDLDLFGAGSLFQLLSLARTRAGEDCLAAWLKHPASAETVRRRQEAVRELGPRLALRERLAVLAADIDEVDIGALSVWCARPETPLPRLVPVLTALLALAALIALGAVWHDFSAWPWLLAAIAAEALVWRVFGPRLQAELAGVQRRADELTVIAGILEVIEGERFDAPLLAALQEGLRTQSVPPSVRIAQLGRLVDTLEWQRNQFFLPFAALVLWGLQWGLRIRAWRHTYGAEVPRWLERLGEFEALASLASYHYERPDDPFAEIVEGGPLFQAEALAHPLLDPAIRVPNSLTLGAASQALTQGMPQVMVVSGTNMSGKSTLLRTVGINAVLALAGAPVTAQRLRLSPVQIGATLHIQDSLQAGRSRFYTEILRLRQVLRLTEGTLPVLFLLDEILHGTNSHDRQVGAAGLIQSLVGRGAIGLVSTHDLSIARVAEELAPRAANVHFVDVLKDGKLEFDYRMRPGAVEHSNALELMRSIGIDV